jgi:hypothetical protein
MSYNERVSENEKSEQAENEASTPSNYEGRAHSEEVLQRRRILAWEKLRRGLDAGEDWSPAHSPAAPAASPGINVPVRMRTLTQAFLIFLVLALLQYPAPRNPMANLVISLLRQL